MQPHGAADAIDVRLDAFLRRELDEDDGEALVGEPVRERRIGVRRADERRADAGEQDAVDAVLVPQPLQLGADEVGVTGAPTARGR